MIQISENIYCVHGLEELTSLKGPHYPKQSIDSMQSLSKYQWHFSQNQKKIILKFIWNHKRPKQPQKSWEKRKSWRNHTTWHQTILQWCRPWPAGSVCCGCDEQIHTDHRSPVEIKGVAWSLSKWERGPQSLPGQAFIVFLGTWHRGWSSCTKHRFTVGDYLLQITKERMLLITSKRRMFQMQGEKWLNWLHSILGRFSTDFRNLLWRYEVNICCLNPGWGSFSISKSRSSLCTMQAWFPTGEPIRGHRSCVPDLAFH